MIKLALFSAKEYEKRAFLPVFADSGDAIACTFFDAALTPDTASLAKGFDVVCVFVNDVVNASTLTRLQSLGVKHVTLRCAGYNQVDIETASALGITISRVPGYSPQAVAEHTIALIMTLNRHLHKAYNRVRDGNFELEGLQGFTLQGKTVGVIGTGKIGQALVNILRGFNCEVLCFDLVKSPEVEAKGAQYTDIPTLLRDSHIVSLHCPLNEQTHHLIDAAALQQMRDNVMLINTSRGGLVDTQAVIKALKTQKLGALGLDVYEMESELFFKDRSNTIIQDDVFQRLLTFPNVLITGHQGFFTHEALDEIARQTTTNIIAEENLTLSSAARVV